MFKIVGRLRIRNRWREKRRRRFMGDGGISRIEMKIMMIFI